MYVILEQQTAADGCVAIPPVQSRADKNEAYSVFYMVLAAAAISSVPLHSATLLDCTGAEMEHKCFSHPLPEPEPEPEPEPAPINEEPEPEEDEATEDDSE